jgi:hypothetical protein
MTCPNGHPVVGDSESCPTCGAGLVPEPEHPTPSMLPPALRDNRKLIAGIAALVLVIGVVLAVTLSSGGHHAKNPSATGKSAHEVCVLQLSAVVSHLIEGGYGPEINEIRVNGADDPYFKIANTLLAPYFSDQTSFGAQQASRNALEAASQACSDELNDTPRPNYPTDGTVPDDTTAVDPNFQPGVPNDYTCPAGTSITNRSDGSGNYICE